MNYVTWDASYTGTAQSDSAFGHTPTFLQRGRGEEVHGCDDIAVIAKEGSPALASVVGRRPAPEVAGDCALGDVEAEFEEFAVDSGGAPGGILADHPSDDSSDLGTDLRPAKALRAWSRAPEEPKPGPMPGDHGFGLDDDQSAAPWGPQPAKKNPEHPIVGSESGPRVLSLEDTELLPKGRDLKAQVAAGAEEGAEAADHADEERDHGTRCIPWGDPGVRVNYLIVLPYGVLATNTCVSAVV